MSRAIVEPILKLARRGERGEEGALLRALVWMRRGLLGQVFGDEEFYCHRPDRHINLLGCCASLLAVSLFTSGVVMLPAWILWIEKDGRVFQGDRLKHLGIGVVACMILVFTLGAFIRLTTGVIKWMVSGWRHFHGRIWVLAALVVSAAMITLVGLGLFNIYSQFGMPEKVF